MTFPQSVLFGYQNKQWSFP